jgi:hypothetical protein
MKICESTLLTVLLTAWSTTIVVAGQAIGPVGANSQYITAICPDSLGNIWVATESEGGLYKYDVESETWAQVTSASSTGDSVTCLICDKHGRIWAGTRAHGVIVINGANSECYDDVAGPIPAYGVPESSDSANCGVDYQILNVDACNPVYDNGMISDCAGYCSEHIVQDTTCNVPATGITNCVTSSATVNMVGYKSGCLVQGAGQKITSCPCETGLGTYTNTISVPGYSCN